jgi:thiol-disulfide isomerase/thioredoxin
MSQTQPDDMRSLSPKIDLLKDMGKYTEAETELNEFLDRNPDDFNASMGLVDVLDEQGRYDEATPHLRRLIETADRTGSAYYKMMTIRCKMNQPDSALAVLDEALATGFNDYRAVMHDPELATMRAMSGYADIKATMQDSISAMKARRNEERSGDRDKRKEEAMAEMIDEPAAGFSLVDLNGNTVTLEGLRGSVVILDFWATWCGPCRLTMPLLQEFNDERGDDMKYFALNVWEADTSEVRPYLAKYGYTFNCLFGENATAADYGVSGIPTMVMIDKNGSIRFRHVGYRPDMDEILGWQLDALLKMK